MKRRQLWEHFVHLHELFIYVWKEQKLFLLKVADIKNVYVYTPARILYLLVSTTTGICLPLQPVHKKCCIQNTIQIQSTLASAGQCTVYQRQSIYIKFAQIKKRQFQILQTNCLEFKSLKTPHKKRWKSFLKLGLQFFFSSSLFLYIIFRCGHCIRNPAPGRTISSLQNFYFFMKIIPKKLYQKQIFLIFAHIFSFGKLLSPR